MNVGFQFEQIVDSTVYRVHYRKHFVDRYEFDFPDHPALKRTMSEDLLHQKIVQALPKIDADMGSLEQGTGIIVSSADHFVMAFGLLKTSEGYQVNMITSSKRVDFTARTAKDYIIKVNPTFIVRFEEPLSLGLTVSILADIDANWEVFEPGITYHPRGELMEYWLERTGDTFYIFQADWIRDLLEIQVS